MENSKKAAFSVALMDNGNAFHKDAMGLNKREYFAGLAMQGMIAKYGAEYKAKKIVEASVEIADELLKQLEIK